MKIYEMFSPKLYYALDSILSLSEFVLLVVSSLLCSSL